LGRHSHHLGGCGIPRDPMTLRIMRNPNRRGRGVHQGLEFRAPGRFLLLSSPQLFMCRGQLLVVFLSSQVGDEHSGAFPARAWEYAERENTRHVTATGGPQMCLTAAESPLSLPK